MRTLRGVLTGAIVLAVTGLYPAAAAHAAAPAAPYNAFIADGYYSASLDESNAGFSLSNTTADSFTFNAYSTWGTTPTSVQVAVAAAAGTHLAVGTYATSSDPGQPVQLVMTYESSACRANGSITIEEVSRDAGTNVITAFAATYTWGCGGTTVGEIRFHSSVGYRATFADHRYKDWGYPSFEVDSSVDTVTIQGWGSNPTTMGAASITGDTDAFRIVSDTCKNTVLAYGQTCTVGVVAHPTSIRAQGGTLLIPDNSALGVHRVLLNATGWDTGYGTYFPIAPARVLDTRSGEGSPRKAVGPGGIVELAILGQGGVPASGVSAVVLNVTAADPTAGSYLTVYPAGSPKPTASSLNFRAGELRSNSVTVAVGAAGKIDIANFTGSVQVIADVTGWYADGTNPNGSGGQFQPTVPGRVLDTRTDWHEPLLAGEAVTLPISFGTYTSHIRALVVNITTINPTANGFVTAWDGLGDNPPRTSTGNYLKGTITPNLAIVPVAPCPSYCGTAAGLPSIGIYTMADTHLAVDIVGFYDDRTQPNGMRYTPQTPHRIVDSRSGLGLPSNLGDRKTGVVTTPGGVLNHADTQALALNLTGDRPTAATFLKSWPAGITGIDQPNISNVNLTKGQTAANAAITLIGPAGKFNVYNNAGSVGVIVDVVGTFWIYEGTASAPAPSAGLTATTGSQTLPSLTGHTSIIRHY